MAVLLDASESRPLQHRLWPVSDATSESASLRYKPAQMKLNRDWERSTTSVLQVECGLFLLPHTFVASTISPGRFGTDVTLYQQSY